MFKRTLTGLVTVCLFSQASAFAISNSLKNYSVNDLTNELTSINLSKNLSKVEIIKSAYQAFKTNIDYKLLSVEEAAKRFSMEIFNKNITEEDMANFVKEYASVDEYNSYLLSMDNAKASLGGEAFTSDELSQLAVSSLSGLDQDALRWSGCASLGVGIVLLAGAVTMGIIALVKGKSEDKVRASFEEKKQELINEHNSNVSFIMNAETEIPAQIANQYGVINSNEVLINQAEVEIINLQFIMLDPATTPEQASAIRGNILNITTRIQLYQSNIRNSIDSINYLSSELVNYQTVDGYAEAQLEVAATNYEVSLAQNNAELETSLSELPANQRQSRNLGIAAGVSAIIGTLVTVNGAQDC